MQIEQSIIVDGFTNQEHFEIIKCLSVIPNLININLTFINISLFTYSAQLKNQFTSNKNFENSLNFIESQKNHDFPIVQQLNAEANIENDNQKFGLTSKNNKSESFKAKQINKPKEIIICSRNSQIGIQFKKSDGLLSNQIFNSKIQSPILTTPLSARNSIYLGQSEIQSSTYPQSDEINNNKGIHQVSQNTPHKNQYITQTKNKSKYLSQFYSQQNYNPYSDSKQINKFQCTHQVNSKIKQQNNDNIKDQNQTFFQSQITNQNSGFKLFNQMQRKSTNNNIKPKAEHVVITLPKSKRKFDSFSSSKHRQQSNNIDQININEHFQRLIQNSEPRELYTQPFFYSQYSQISKITLSSASENYKQNLYKPIKKQRKNLEYLNKSYDHPQQQYYSDDSFEGKSQNIKKVDLYKLSQERVDTLQNSNEKTNFNFSSSIRNPNSNTLESRQINQRANNVEEQIKTSNFQTNFHYYQDNQTESQIQQTSFSPKKPIQIKLNLKQFITSENLINQPKSSPIAFNLSDQLQNRTAINY